MNERIQTAQAPEPVGAYPHARRIGDWLILSGLGPRIPGSNRIPGNHLDEDGRLIGWDIEIQTHQLIANLSAVLAECGAGLEQLVDITVFLIDMDRDFAAFNRVYDEYFAAITPCRTTVEVGALPTSIAVEFKCLAWLGEDR